MPRLVRTRWLLRSRPVRSWLVLVALAGAALGSWHHAWSQAESQRRQWGSRSLSVVTTAEVAAGESLAGLVMATERPSAHLPTGALRNLPPDGWIATRELTAGAVLTADDVVAPEGSPMAPGPDEAALAVPLDARVPPLVVGDVVALVATGTYDVGGNAAVLTEDARVIGVGPEAAIIALDRSQLAPAANAITRGSLVVAISASRPPTPPG